ncbi:hypothetical protein M378DRAFT_164138 [Amanita muscaria Koide BX008]|uniref:NACHT domain-containing protein n=1 Tax=Amanita muscaria (strain Koide BX008) TaxID=946122 RepID=A0A0C2X3C6_AMAMK|nr:hypothetical protein M378DRAFT_164138 [Amanita muscaria Koide BX008]
MGLQRAGCTTYCSLPKASTSSFPIKNFAHANFLTLLLVKPAHNSATNHNLQSTDTSQHPIQHKNTHGWLTTFIFRLFQWFLLPMRVLVAVITLRHEPQVPVAKQLEGIQGSTFSGNNQFTNIGMNTGTVNNYGTTHGLENLKEFVSFAALYDSSAQDPDRRCHPGTRENVLMRLRHWFDNPNATDRIFWLHGPAGAGKSAIAQTIAHEYKEKEVAATFFFFRSDAARNDGNRLFPTIAWQLAFYIPATKEFIVQALDKAPHLPTSDVETQFEQLVAQIFQRTNNIASQMPHPAPVVIIDGLDECLDEHLQRRILAVIGNAVKDHRVPLRFIISSRPESLVEDALNQFQDFTLRIDLATLDDSNRDVETYLVDKFSDIASKQGLKPSWPGQEIIEEFVFESSGNFILASTLIRYIGDEDYSAESQLDIVRKLKPHGSTSPFAFLDELYLEILKQPRDQDFLKSFLALLVGRSSVKEYKGYNLHEDDITLMNVSEQELHIKLRRMRSLLKLEPFIDVYHKSFLDFLQDSSRSGEYHVSKQDGQKRYLELIVNSVVRHVSKAIEESNCHETCHSNPSFSWIVSHYPPMIALAVKDWQETLKPLLDLQDKCLKTLKPQQLCNVTQVMRDLQVHLVILQRSSHDIAAAPAPEPNNDEIVTEWSPEAMQNTPEKDLDWYLSGLLSQACLQKTNTLLAVDKVMIERMSSLLADPAETAARVRSVTDAQKLIDIVDSCGRDAARKAYLLASEICTRVPVFPQSVRLDDPTLWTPFDWFSSHGSLEEVCSSAVINRILCQNRTLQTWCIFQRDERWFVFSNVNEQKDPVDQWLACPNSVTRIRVMLEIARTIRYLHSMDVATRVWFQKRKSQDCLRAQFVICSVFAWQGTSEFTVSIFADFFRTVCFNGDDENLNLIDNGNLPNGIVEDVRQLIERCAAPDPPTMEDIVKEMERWNLSDGDDEFDGDDENLSDYLVEDATCNNSLNGVVRQTRRAGQLWRT